MDCNEELILAYRCLGVQKNTNIEVMHWLTAKFDLSKYMEFLLYEPKSATCTRLSELSDMPHDSVNRFLQCEKFTPNDLIPVNSRKTPF